MDINTIRPGCGRTEDNLLDRTKKLLRRVDVRARKRLGQHFLVDEKALEKVVESAGLGPDDSVLEVGPGLGTLTQELSRRAGKLIAVELDDRLAAVLAEDFKSRKNVEIVNGDILKLDLKELLWGLRGYKLVANLPYYITSAVLRRFLEAAGKPRLMVVMVQKEVAEAIAAGPGKMSLLAVSVQFYGKPRVISLVPASSFYPPPEVDSAILKIDVYPEPAVPVRNVDGFFRLVRAGFCASRKQLLNSLSQGLGIGRADAALLLEEAGIEPKRRAEALSLEEWFSLWQAMERRQM